MWSLLSFRRGPDPDRMAATAWDEGVELYAAASPRSGHAWCQVAITIAHVTNGLLAAQVQFRPGFPLVGIQLRLGLTPLASSHCSGEVSSKS